MRISRVRWWSALAIVLACGFAAGDVRADDTSKTPVNVDVSKGPLTISSGDNSLTLGAWIQMDYIGDDRDQFDGDSTGKGLGREDGYSSQFKIARLRVYLQGTVYRPWVGYKFEFEFGNTSGENDSKIKDGYIQVDKERWATVRFGQFKVPFSLQQLTQDRSQAFVDRAITDGKFAVGRDLGVMLGGLSENRMFGYSAGAFNGGGESRAQDDRGMLYAARVWYDPLGEYKLSAGAIDNPEDTMILHFGLSGRTGEVAKGTATPGVFEDPDNETALGAEVAWRYRRLWATAEYFRMTDEERNPVRGPDIDSTGLMVELTGLISPHAFELGARYAQIDPDDDVDNDDVKELRGLAAWYLKGHNLKLQLDAGETIYDKGFGGDPALARRGILALGTRLGPVKTYHDKQVRLQAQLAF